MSTLRKRMPSGVDWLREAEKLEQAVRGRVGEERLQQLLRDIVLPQAFRSPILTEHFAEGFLPKFMIAPGRIPDFVHMHLECLGSQAASRIEVIELKLACKELFVGRGRRFSSHFNDALVECLQAYRNLLSLGNVAHRFVESTSWMYRFCRRGSRPQVHSQDPW